MGIFGTSGIRRVADKELFKIAFRTGLAIGSMYRKVVVGRDTRTTSSALRHAVITGVLAGGAECADAGIVPTPTLAYAARNFNAGVMITASHNPPEYNGIKLFNPDGSSFSEQQQVAIEQAVNYETNIATWKDFHPDFPIPQAIEDHIHRILQDVPHNLSLKVVVDCAGAAAYRITPSVLNSMGCEVIPLNIEPTGYFPHDPEPVETNLRGLIQKVKDTGADLGIAHDGDADRMMAIDNRGRFISGDKMLVILAREAGVDRVVTTIDASMSLERSGFQVIRTKVGDPYVSETLKQEKLYFGGEPSGAWVFSSFSFCPDGPYAAARLVKFASQNNLADIIDSIPSFPVRRGSIQGQGLNLDKLENKLKILRPVSISRTDGLKIDFLDGWLLVRPSGTEPKIRITAEALTEDRSNELYIIAEKIISDTLKGM